MLGCPAGHYLGRGRRRVPGALKRQPLCALGEHLQSLECQRLLIGINRLELDARAVFLQLIGLNADAPGLTLSAGAFIGNK